MGDGTKKIGLLAVGSGLGGEFRVIIPMFDREAIPSSRSGAAMASARRIDAAIEGRALVA
jgi:hypothetical protein